VRIVRGATISVEDDANIIGDFGLHFFARHIRLGVLLEVEPAALSENAAEPRSGVRGHPA